MIKRRFYKQDHGDNSGSSDSSSSDDFNFAHEVESEGDQVEEEGKGSDKKALCYPSPGSGYESESSLDNQGENDTSDLLTNEEEENDVEDLDNTKDCRTINELTNHENERASGIEENTIDPNVQAEIAKFILKCKSTYKCRLCSRILCLNEATLMAHLTSKKHARSKKLLAEGRLKLMLNSDGELEEEQETHAERHARILALSQEAVVSKKRKNKPQKSHRRKKVAIGSEVRGKTTQQIDLEQLGLKKI